MHLKLATQICLAFLLVGSVTGCAQGSGTDATSSPADAPEMKTMRAIYDSVHGDYNKLTAKQKKQLLDYEKGNATNVSRLWAYMKIPPSG